MKASLEIEERDAKEVILRPKGALDLKSSRELFETLQELATRASLQGVTLDMNQVTEMDSSGIAVLAIAADLFQEKNKQLRLENLNDDQQAAISMMPARDERDDPVDEELGFLASIGDNAFAFLEEARAFTILLINTMIAFYEAIFKGKRPPRGAFTEQAVAVGVDALPIVGLLSMLLGLILAFQAAYQLQQFGANIFVANLVGISMVREFGPMMTGIIIAGRSGSAIAAELGTMVVQEEVDALHTMGIDHKRFLVLPKLMALMTMQPALTLFANLIGIFGGFVIATLYLDLAPTVYIDQTIISVKFGDWLHGLLKSFVFAILIGMVGCYSGLNIEGGASAVGRATTRAVVAGIFLLILSDSVFAMITTLSKGA